jgi:hypothetical protein
MSGPSVVLKGVEDEWRRASRPKGEAAPTSPQTLPPAQRLHPACPVDFPPHVFAASTHQLDAIRILPAFVFASNAGNFRAQVGVGMVATDPGQSGTQLAVRVLHRQLLLANRHGPSPPGADRARSWLRYLQLRSTALALAQTSSRPPRFPRQKEQKHDDFMNLKVPRAHPVYRLVLFRRCRTPSSLRSVVPSRSRCGVPSTAITYQSG